MNWEPIESAPRDGTLVWLAVKPFIMPLTAAEHEKVDYQSVLVRYDTWEWEWRLHQTGEQVRFPKWCMPKFWMLCERPKPPEKTA